MRIIALAIAGLVIAFAALAQETVERVAYDASRLPVLIERGEAALARGTPSDIELSDARLALDGYAVQAAFERAERQTRLDEIVARLETLVEGGDEMEVAAERTRLDQERIGLVASIGALDDELMLASDVSERIVQRRRELFSDALLKRQDIVRALNGVTTGALAEERRELQGVIDQWVRDTLLQRPADAMIAALMVVIGALGALVATRRLRAAIMPVVTENYRPTYLARISSAFARVVMRTFGVALVAALAYGSLRYLDLLPGAIEPIVFVTLSSAVAVQFAIALLNAVLTPRRPAWRLIDLDDRSAREAFVLGTGVVFVFVFDVLFGQIATIMGAPVSLVVVQNFAAAIVNGALLIAIARMHVRPLGWRTVAPAMAVDDPTPPARHSGRWPAYIRVPLMVLGVGLIGAALLGYIGLAQFTAQQIVVTGAILGTMYVGLLTARAVSMNDAVRTSAIGRAMGRRAVLSPVRYDQLGVALGLMVRLGVIAIGVPLILMQWGFRAEEIGSWIVAAMTGVTIGSVTFSLGGILLAIGVFAIGWLLTRTFQRWLDTSVMERSRVDPGVRNSVRTVTGYALLGLLALFALSIAGVNFTSLAVVAGALSVGIGFGLQNVVSNFVSGLILLAERPFRVGDIVETGSTLGVIQKIAVRATTIETFTKQSVIVPNSDLINGVVSNWTLGNRLTRADIPIGVEYGANPRRVHELLLSIAQAHPLSLADPEPMVVFNGFGESSLDFELRFYLANVSDKIGVVNEVSYQIFEKLADVGIAIPFPQRDVNVRVEGEDDMPAALVHRIAAQAAE